MLKHSISRVKISFVNKFPFLSVVSRFSRALYYSSILTRPSYSQHEEDKFVINTLDQNFAKTKYNYVDVGGFHPVSLSNTYLMYRKKMNGIVIEPNPELLRLHKIFRPRDIQLPVACAKENKLDKFYVQKTFPALSSLEKGGLNKKIKCHYVPVLNLDTILSSLELSEIYFLSIDVEGYDFDVLKGGEKTLQRTFLLCVECNSHQAENEIKFFLSGRGFVLLKSFGCNFFFKNENFQLSGG
jgi:FkbM family methyltransferase